METFAILLIGWLLGLIILIPIGKYNGNKLREKIYKKDKIIVNQEYKITELEKSIEISDRYKDKLESDKDKLKNEISILDENLKETEKLRVNEYQAKNRFARQFKMLEKACNEILRLPTLKKVMKEYLSNIKPIPRNLTNNKQPSE